MKILKEKIFKCPIICRLMPTALEITVKKQTDVKFTREAEKLIARQMTEAELRRADSARTGPDVVRAEAFVAANGFRGIRHYLVTYFDAHGKITGSHVLFPEYFFRREEMPPRLQHLYAGPQ